MAEQAATDEKRLAVTKVVTLRDFEHNDPLPPPEKWVKCFRVADCLQELSTNVMQEWELPDTYHVLLHIDVPNQQLYHLPLLVTPVHCVYLVTFDLREEAKALETIHRAMKHISAFVSYSTNSLLDNHQKSNVLLVGTHREAITDNQRLLFAQKLQDALKRRYHDLIVMPSDVFWAVEGDSIDIHNSNIFKEIKCHSCQPQVPTCRCIKYGNELLQKFPKKTVVRSKLPPVSRGDVERFLAFLHDYGFIVYSQYKELQEEDTSVVLNPQYLCELFAKAQELSKKRDSEVTVDGLFSSNAKLERSMKKWFETFCIRMGLVIREPMGEGQNLVFVLRRQVQSERESLAFHINSVDPLLVTYKPRGNDADSFIPPRFFPAFASAFLKLLHDREECKDKLNVSINQSQAHIVVVWDVGCHIHVLEQESCIEIGFQLDSVNWKKHRIDAKFQKLQNRCQIVRTVVCQSAGDAARNLTLPGGSACVQYGFYHACGDTIAIGVRVSDEVESALQCRRCRAIPCTPMQDIWFQDVKKCEVQPHEDDSKTLKLVEGNSPQRPTPQPDQAQQVLNQFRSQFIDIVDANAIVHDLKHEGIIDGGDLTIITKTPGGREQNAILHECLLQKCTEEALMKVCKIIVDRDHPRMKELGEQMKSKLDEIGKEKEEEAEEKKESLDVLKFQEQYSEVVRNQASVTLKITKCTTIGPPRIGKTCLKNLLIGEEWDVEAGTASTDVMEAPEWVECYSLEEGGAEKPWKLLSAEQQQGELIRAVNSSITSNAQLMTTPSDAPSTTTPSDALPTTTPSDAPPTTTPSDAPPTTTPSDAPSTTTPSDAPPTTTPSDAPSTTTIEPCDAPPTIGPSDAPPTTTIGPSDAPPPATIEPCDAPPTIGPCDAPPTTTPSHTEFRTMPTSASPPATMRTPTQNLSTVQQILDDLSGAVSLEKLQDFLKDKQGKILGETRLVHFIDTGGQAIYHDVHPVLITSPSVYLVVFSLKDFYRKKNEERLDYFRNELIQRPLRSIYTFGRKTPTEKDHLQLHPEAPKIFIVGTHLDHVCQADTLSCEEFLQTVHDMIDREISSKPYHQFVQYDTKGRSFWAVDNTLAGREQSEGVKEYISTLRLMVQERTMEMSVKVPLTWMLLRRVMEGKGEQYCKYAELLEQARIRGYVREGSPEKDLDTMLKLFHILGIFYHKVPKGCKKEDSLVFIDPGCLYSTTSDFLMAAKEEMEDSQGASHEDHHQIPTPLEQPNVELTRREDPSYMSQECQEATHQRPVALRSRDSATSQKLTQSAPVQKDLRGGVESVKVFGRISNIVRDFLFDMHTVLGTLERIVIKVYREPPEVILRNLMRIQQGVEEKCCSDAANTLQSKYRILAQAMVFKLINTVRKVLQSSTSEDKKPQLDSIMRDFWCQCRMTRRSIDVDDLHHLLLLLTELRIIARLNHPDCYVIPASLPQLRGQITPVVGGIEPLLFTVRSQDRRTYFLPSGLFCCLISELVTGLGWTVKPLGRTHVTFTHEDLTGVVHVVEHESYIKLEYVQVKEVSTCKFVRERMHEKISLMYSTIYDPPDESKVAMVASPESRRAVVGFKCNCGRGPTHAPHIAAYEEDEFESCLRCLLPRPMSTELSPLMDEHLVWFS